LAEESGVSRPVRVDDPRVLVGRVRSTNFETVLFVNCSGEAVAVEPVVEGGAELPSTANLRLEAFGVAAVPLERTPPGDTEPATRGGVRW